MAFVPVVGEWKIFPPPIEERIEGKPLLVYTEPEDGDVEFAFEVVRYWAGMGPRCWCNGDIFYDDGDFTMYTELKTIQVP